MMGYYVLDADHAIHQATFQEWAVFMALPFDASRRVAKTAVGDAEVSTVFLGLDHSFAGSTPILFETMVLGGEHDGEQWRYATWAEAEAGHARIVAIVTDKREQK